MKKYIDFIKESKLKGTKGISDDYISNVERRASADNGAPVNTSAIMPLVFRANELVIGDIVNVNSYMMGRVTQEQSNRIRERHAQLEELAVSVIRHNYGSILDNIDLDIKLVSLNQVSEFLDGNSEDKIKAKPKVDSKNDEQLKKKDSEEAKKRNIKIPDSKKDSNKEDSKDSSKDNDRLNAIKSGIDKRKIANNIIQGEAKNTKNILHTSEVKDGLTQIFGERKALEIFNLWDSITKMANKLDWQIPVSDKARMMEDQPIGMAGAVSCEWPDKPSADDDQKSDILKSLESGDDDDNDEGGDFSEDAKDAMEDLFSQGNPKIKAVGIDFPMLLHETVKGIYEMIAAVAIPEDASIASVVQMATSSFEDEAEDFKYGPYIAGDIRDFIFRNDLAIEKPNVREHVFGKLMELPDDEFFDLISKILQSKIDGRDDASARRRIDSIISDIVDEIKKWELGEVIGHDNDNEDYNDDNYEDAQDEDDKSSDDFKHKSGSSNDREMSQADLERAIDDAFDNDDMEEVKRLTSELVKRFPK